MEGGSLLSPIGHGAVQPERPPSRPDWRRHPSQRAVWRDEVPPSALPPATLCLPAPRLHTERALLLPAADGVGSDAALRAVLGRLLQGLPGRCPPRAAERRHARVLLEGH